MSRRVRILVIIGLSILVAFSFFLNAAIVTAKYYEGRILPNTVVSGIDVSGMKQSEADSLISQKASAIASQQLTMQLGDTTATTTATNLGVAIDEDATLNSLTSQTNVWGWSRLAYWKDFFRQKHQAFVYSVDETKLTETLNKIFPVSQEATDAAITVKNGQLETTLAAQGVTIDLNSIKANLQAMMANASTPSSISVVFAAAMPSVSNEEAQKTKDEIQAAIKPVYLTYSGTNYTIEAKDFYSYISYDKKDGQLNWQLTQTSIQTLINDKIGKKINVKMRQRTIMSDTGQVTDQGQEGKTVDGAALAATIYQMTSTGQYNTATTAVSIPVTTTPITDKTVTPSFVLGQYTGRYITINLSDQKMYLIDGNALVATYTVSSGKWSTPTPTGTFYIMNKISMAYSRPFNLYMPLWNALAPNPDGSGYNGVGIHGLPCFNKSCSLREGVNHIGTPVSHGCIRVDDAGAQVVYDWAPVGTPVVINK